MKPTELKMIQGTLRKHRERKKPKHSGKKIRASNPISINDQAKKYFRNLVHEMNQAEMLKPRDTYLLAMLSSVLADVDAIERELMEPDQGLTVEDNVGKVKRSNPLLRYKYKAIDTAMQLSKKFGLSPQDRAMFRLPEKPQESDPIGELLKAANE